MERDYQGGHGGAYDGGFGRGRGRSTSSLAEKFTTALKNKQHSLEQWPPTTALPLALWLMILVQDPLQIMVLRWFSGCGIGDLDIRVESRWSLRDRVLAT